MAAGSPHFSHHFWRSVAPGNGIQHAFYDDPNVMYISLHRFENGRFYPHNRDADLDAVGGPGAEGRNVNIPWPTDGMCDGDYLHAFQRVILPIAYEFDPQLVFGTRQLYAMLQQVCSWPSLTLRVYRS